MKTYKEYILEADKKGIAMGHFNISNSEQLHGIMNAAVSMKSPILIGTSEGERKFIGLKQAVSLVRAFREETGIPVFLNADHSKSGESAIAAIDAGYDSVHIDVSHLPYDENVKITNYVREHAKMTFRPDIGEIHVEAELGLLLGESKIQKETIEVRPEQYTKPEEAADFVKKTGIDRLAPAVGNIHGIPANEKKIDIKLIKKIREAIPTPRIGITLHGASGISDNQIVEAVRAGVNNIHINTEIRVVFVRALKQTFFENPEETTPYKLYSEAIIAVQRKVEEKLKLFGSINRI